MDLISALNDLVESHHGSTGLACSAGSFLRSLNEKERETFETILNTRSVPVTNLLELLKKNGYKVTQSALYKHRQKICRCFN